MICAVSPTLSGGRWRPIQCPMTWRLWPLYIYWYPPARPGTSESLLAFCLPKGSQETRCRCAPSPLFTLFRLMTFSKWCSFMSVNTVTCCLEQVVGLDPHLGFQRYTSRSRFEEARRSLRLLHLGLQHFRHFSHATRFCVRAEPNVARFCARAVFIPAMKKEDDVTNNTELLVCLLSGPFRANKKKKERCCGQRRCISIVEAPLAGRRWKVVGHSVFVRHKHTVTYV